MLNGNRQAVVQLDFLIVGGGIAGLATAYALAASGHRVRVLEKLSGPGQRAGGVRIPPNVTKILLEWGLGEELTKRASKVRPTNLEDFETGEIIGYLEWQEDVMKESGAPFLMMHHQDLYEILYKLALSAGAQVLFNSTGSISAPQPPAYKAPAAEYATPRAQVTLTNGQVLEADVIVGADGPHSFVRKFVEEEEVEERWSGMNVYTGTLPMSEMQSHPLLREVLDLGWPMWMGDSRSTMGVYLRNDTEYSVHVWWTEDEPEGSEGWDLEIPASHLLKYGNVEPRLRTLFERTKTFSRQKLMERPAPEDWVDGSERLVLVGEAAHPLMPCGTHGCSLAVEDAAVLGTLFSHLRSHEQIATLLYAYQDLRQERAGILNELELSNAGLCWFAPGPERDARNESMRQSRAQGSEHWDDSALGDQWGVISEVWGYHAVDAAEDWWVQWGLLRERAAFGAQAPAGMIQIDSLQVSSVSVDMGDESMEGAY
ncbi:FAD/NAD(P)-binding domain-containing protein [Dentipellis sp. KUC8613]|nr:FAD/NAD(P)-binding domain-containing protein [Dentipellis sp. KUC8613]